MAGNSKRRGAVRREGSKKGQQSGSGGQRRRSLEGKGPTPLARVRPGHPAAQQVRRADTPAGVSGKRPSRGQRTATRRRDEGQWIAGRNPVLEALLAGVPVTGVYVSPRLDADSRIRQALQLANDRNIALLEASKTDLDRMTGGAVHQGIAARMPAYEYAHPMDVLQIAYDRGQQPLIVALDGVTDPRNLGAIIRSVAAFGGHGVVMAARRSAAMGAAAWKTSAGAAARIPVARAANLTRALEDYQKSGCRVIGLAADGEVRLRDSEAVSMPLVVVVGAEDAGLSRLVRETCDAVTSIPMAGHMESLNAAVAAGIALYEVAQQRDVKSN